MEELSIENLIDIRRAVQNATKQMISYDPLDPDIRRERIRQLKSFMASYKILNREIESRAVGEYKTSCTAP